MLTSLTAIVFFLYGGLGFPNLPPIPLEKPALVLRTAAPEPCPEKLRHRAVELARKLEFFSSSEGGWDHLKINYLTGPKLSAQIDLLIKKYAKRHGIDENLVRAVLHKESGGNPTAVSPKFAMGLMQLIPETAIAMGVQDPFNPEQNVAGGVKYLKYCLDRFSQDVILALAAYNAGPEAVKKHGGVPPYAETQQYVASIIGCPVEDIVNNKTEEAKRQGDHQASPQQPKQAGLLPKPTWKVVRSEVTVPAPKWKIIPSFTTFTSSQFKVDTIPEGARFSKDRPHQAGDPKEPPSHQGNIAIPRFLPSHGYR